MAVACPISGRLISCIKIVLGIVCRFYCREPVTIDTLIQRIKSLEKTK